MAELSILPGTLNVRAQKGKTWTVPFTIRDDTGALVNLTGYSIAWALSESFGAAALLSATTSDYLTLNGALGTGSLSIPPSITVGIAVGNYVHEFELTEPSGGKPPFITGLWTVTGEGVL